MHDNTPEPQPDAGLERQQSMVPAWQGSEAERTAAIRGAIANAGLRGRIAGDTERLVLYLDHNSGDAGISHARVETLCRALRLPRRTIQRRLSDLRGLGWLETKESFRRRYGGQSSNANRIAWDAIRAAATGTQADATTPQSPGCQNGAPVRHGDTPVRHGGAPVRHGDTPSLFSCIDPLSSSTASLRGRPADAISDAPSGAARDTGSPETWEEAVEEVSKFGVGLSVKACEAARRAGVGPAFVIACVRWASAQRARWDRPPGALYLRLTFARPGQRPDDPELWPAPSERFLAAQQAQQRAADLARREAESADRAAERAAAAHAANELEAVAGERMAALTDEQIGALLREHEGTDGVLWAMWMKAGRASPLVRMRVLELLAPEVQAR